MRIVSLVPSVTETLFELGLDEEIVGVTRFCKLPAEKVRRKQTVGGTKNPKLEKIIEMKPDVVIMDRDENRKEDAEFLQHQNVSVMAVFPRSVRDAIDLVRELGDRFAARERAGLVVQEIQLKISEMKNVHRGRTLILIWRRPYMTINQDTYVHSICELFGFENVFAQHSERYPKLTQEQIREANPEVVLMPDEPYPFRLRNIEEWKELFSQTEAAQNNQLFIFDGTLITWPGFGTLRALRELPRLLK